MQDYSPIVQESLPSVTCRQVLKTDDSETILRFAVDARNAGISVVMITLVSIAGGSSRSLGAQMAVREDGGYCGYVSGGCVEAAAAFEALDVIRTGQDKTVIYGEGSPYMDIVLPCGGGITLSFHLLTDAGPVISVLERLSQRKPAALYYEATAQLLSFYDANDQPLTGWNDGVFTLSFRPKIRVIIFGRSVEAETTASIALAAGYDVLQAYPENMGNVSGSVDRESAIVLLYHDLDSELPVLLTALSTSAFYVGAQGSRRTHTERLKKLRTLGVNEENIARIRAPIGIFPSARNARTLALSILAEVASVHLSTSGVQKKR